MGTSLTNSAGGFYVRVVQTRFPDLHPEPTSSTMRPTDCGEPDRPETDAGLDRERRRESIPFAGPRSQEVAHSLNKPRARRKQMTNACRRDKPAEPAPNLHDSAFRPA
jgi:NAD(P)H-dependent flavin oxidoreductase YrpB (nitropropane dioxygenase family)